MDRSGPKLAPFALLRWTFSPGRHELGWLVSTLLVVWLCELAVPFVLGATVDASVSSGHNRFSILECCAAGLVITVILYGAHVLYLRAEASLIARATFDLRRHLYGNVIEQPLSFLRNRSAGEVAHAIMSDSDVIDRHGIYLFAEIPFAALTILGVSVAMLWTQPRLGLLALVTLTMSAILTRAAGRPLAECESATRASRVVMGGRLQEILDGFRVVKLFGREKHEIGRMDEAGAQLARGEAHTGKVMARLEPLLELVKSSGFLVTVAYGAYLISVHMLTAGKLVTFVALVEIVSEPIQSAGRYYAHYAQARAALGRICSFLTGLEQPQAPGSETASCHLSLELHAVRLGSDDGTRMLLDGVSLAASAGDIVAIVGPNGAGKSTLMDVLLGLRHPDSGSVIFGGVPLEKWDTGAFRERTAAVPQECFLFGQTIEDNIRYGFPRARSGILDFAAREAGLAPLLARLPQGLQTVVGERGYDLSGGERQRIALARALIGVPKILVLDEPTSYLDREGLAIFRRAIDRGREERITVLVAHDWETVSVANRIVMLDGGRVIAQGDLHDFEPAADGQGIRPRRKEFPPPGDGSAPITGGNGRDFTAKSAMDAGSGLASMRPDSTDIQEHPCAPP